MRGRNREKKIVFDFGILKKEGENRVCFFALPWLLCCVLGNILRGSVKSVFQIRKDKRQVIDNKNHGWVRRGKIKTNV